LRRSCSRVSEHVHAAPEQDAEAATVNVEITAESLGQFISRVQPVLMNTCASCHVSGKGGNFKLYRSNEGGFVNRHATQCNLKAVLAQIKPDHWQASPFLTKSISIHGNTSAPPTKGRQSAAYKALEEWVKQTLEDNAQLQSAGPVANLPPDKPADAGPPDGKSKPGQTTAAVPSREPIDRKASDVTGSAFGVNQTPKAVSRAPSNAPRDPFDPALFNQANKPPR